MTSTVDGDDAAAAELLQAGGAGEDRGVVDADGDDVVGVVGDGGGERAARQAEAGDEAAADAAGRVVALDHGDLGEVARRVGDDVAVRARGGDGAGDRDQLLRDDLDHAHVAVGLEREVGLA